MLRKRMSVMTAITLAGMMFPGVAGAGGWYARVGFAGPVYPGGFAFAGYPSYPLDDSFDYPFGYGEYAEYGPWAFPGCRTVARRVPTAHGPRVVWFRSCR